VSYTDTDEKVIGWAGMYEGGGEMSLQASKGSSSLSINGKQNCTIFYMFAQDGGKGGGGVHTCGTLHFQVEWAVAPMVASLRPW